MGLHAEASGDAVVQGGAGDAGEDGLASAIGKAGLEEVVGTWVGNAAPMPAGAGPGTLWANIATDEESLSSASAASELGEGTGQGVGDAWVPSQMLRRRWRDEVHRLQASSGKRGRRRRATGVEAGRLGELLDWLAQWPVGG